MGAMKITESTLKILIDRYTLSGSPSYQSECKAAGPLEVIEKIIQYSSVESYEAEIREATKAGYISGYKDHYNHRRAKFDEVLMRARKTYLPKKK